MSVARSVGGALSVIGVLALVLAGGVGMAAWGWNAAHPCWRYSNAAWCGHFCDDDPCMCPDRSLGPSAYAGGPGCVP